MLKYFLCWILYKFGYTTNAIGGYRMKSAMKSFTDAQHNLAEAIESEGKVLEKTQKRLDEQTRKLKAQIQAHEKIQKDSGKFLRKLNQFLDVEDEPDSGNPDNNPHGDSPATDLADAQAPTTDNDKL